jgi:TPP-dependent trihydroxycyclohexane-1,2-dione (THcHDO) dehydratase
LNKSYADPPRQTIEDLDPESATTDHLIAMVHNHREGEIYPTPEQLLGNLPVALRALCDHVLTGKATALDVAYRLASIIDALEDCPAPPASTQRLH